METNASLSAMQPTITSCRRFSVRALAFVFMLVGVASCSTLQLSYNNADPWLRWTADRYFELQPAQIEELRARVARFHDWHRRHELPQYAELMRSAAKRVAGGLSQRDIQWAVENLRNRYRVLLSQAITDAGPMLATLSPEQLAHLEKRLDEDNRKFADRFLPDSEAKRVDARVRRLKERLSDWLGTVTDAQQARIVAMVHATPDLAAVQLARRKRNQLEFVDILRRYRSADSLAAELSRLLENWEAHPSVELAREAKIAEMQFYQMLLDLDRMASPDQRAHAVRRFERYAEDFDALAAESGNAQANGRSVAAAAPNR